MLESYLKALKTLTSILSHRERKQEKALFS
jgi:hypothetical protein